MMLLLADGTTIRMGDGSRNLLRMWKLRQMFGGTVRIKGRVVDVDQLSPAACAERGEARKAAALRIIREIV